MYSCVWQADFFKKKSSSGKNDPETWFWNFLRKKKSLVLSGICVKSSYGSLTFCENHMLGKKIWFSSYSQKRVLANEISIFFNRQYFTNRLISDSDFWQVDRHEWKKQGSLTGFLKKILFWGNGPIWAQKLCILVTLDPLKELF